MCRLMSHDDGVTGDDRARKLDCPESLLTASPKHIKRKHRPFDEDLGASQAAK
jgi:hypothetical protein